MKFFTFLLLLVTTSFSQGNGLDPELSRRAEFFALQYERMLTGTLSKYYRANSYIVDARVTLDEMLIPSEEVPDEILSQIDQLPGLPVLPDELKAGDKELSKYRKEYGIKFVDINVLVDTSYQVSDFEFILEIVTMIGNLDEFRGDRIHIEKKAFPGVEMENPRLTDSLVVPTAEKTWQESVLGTIPNLLPWLLAVLALIILLWMILHFLKSKRIKAENKNEDKLKEIADEIHQIHEITEEGIEYHLPKPKENSVQKQSHEILEHFIGDPTLCTGILADWMENEGEKGISNTAILLQSVDEKLFPFLKERFDESQLNALHFRMQTLKEDDLEKASNVLLAFEKDFKNRKSPVLDHHQGDIFNFLNQISDRQILHILKDESAGIVGVALAQIKSERAANLLHQMEESKRREVLVSMGQLGKLSIQSFKDVAKKLSRKALAVSNMRFVAADGTETIIDILVDMPTDTQRNYLNSITERDIQLAERIRNFFVPFEDIAQLPARIMLELLQDCEPEVLSMAFVGVSEGALQKIMEAFPERMSKRLRSGLTANESEGHDKIEAARRELIKFLRKQIKQRGGLHS